MSLQVIVCAGGGGVGKTTTSSALAASLARSGKRALIVSIDPARRLADAMGVPLDGRARLVDIDSAEGELWGLMPDPRDSMRTFIELLFEGQPEALTRMLDNRLYKVLEDAVPGIHELVAMTLTGRACTKHAIDVVVIDTAPSRYAVDFVRYPGRLAKLLGGRAVGWLARLAQRDPSSRGRRTRTERLLTRVLGPVVHDVAGLFSELALVRERFVELTRQTSNMLLGERTRYILVAAPTAAAQADADYLMRQLGQLKISAKGLILNCAISPEYEFTQVLAAASETTEPIREVLRGLDDERTIRDRAVTAVSEAFMRRHPGVPQIRLPFVEATEPRTIVRALSLALDTQLATITGHS